MRAMFTTFGSSDDATVTSQQQAAAAATAAAAAMLASYTWRLPGVDGASVAVSPYARVPPVSLSLMGSWIIQYATHRV